MRERDNIGNNTNFTDFVFFVHGTIFISQINFFFKDQNVMDYKIRHISVMYPL